jgi:ABC-2 type transport system ATP-binding protein
MLTINGFKKSYNATTVLHIDQLEIGSGIYWIRGENGSGKSTFLKALAGAIAFEGDVILHPHVSLKKQAVAYRKRVNFAEAEPIFPDFLTGLELIQLFSSAKGGSKKQQNEYIERMNIELFVNDPLRTYSSGMLKKLSLVMSFIGNPTLILLDEPLITLDTDSLSTLYSWIGEINRQQGVSFLLSSHQMLESEQLPVLKEMLVEQQTIKYA